MTKEIFSWIKVILVAVIAAVCINTFILANAQVPTGSMSPTVPEKARIMGFRLAYNFEEPERGDVIIFRYPDDETQNYLKRIIGLPGETLEIIDGRVYINGSDTPLDEPYLTVTPVGSFGPYEIPENCYFMMGDNRNNSLDSRYWANTFVSRDKIIAKAIFMYYPSLKLLN